MTSLAANWGGTSHVTAIGGPVHYVDFGGPADGPRLVMVHGLAGDHLNWCLLAPKLADRARMFAVDLIGFGLSEPLGRSATVWANTDMLDQFIRQTVGAPVILVGNSMGGLVALRLARRRPDTVAGVVLIDPALPFVLFRPDLNVVAPVAVYALPGLGRRLLARDRSALSAQQQVQLLIDLCFVDKTGLSEELRATAAALVRQRATMSGLDAAFGQAARSIVAVNARPFTAWAKVREVRAPVLLLHGERDRLVPVRASRVAARHNPEWTVEYFPGIGHVPQLEAPDLVAARILDWLDGPGAPAARAATPAGGSQDRPS
jgi:pimeloyl-ACP methyl ester carboxylesterase